jgi:hypothetical protein
MRMRRTLVVLGALQLVAGLAGHVVAVRQRRTFDLALLGWRGRPERVARDALIYGTALSAPQVMLVAQLAAVVRLAAGPSRPAARTLGLLGAAMVPGCALEREFRQALRPGGFDPVITPIAVAGFGLAIPMAVLGLTAGR